MVKRLKVKSWLVNLLETIGDPMIAAVVVLLILLHLLRMLRVCTSDLSAQDADPFCICTWSDRGICPAVASTSAKSCQNA